MLKCCSVARSSLRSEVIVLGHQRFDADAVEQAGDGAIESRSGGEYHHRTPAGLVRYHST